MNSSELQQTLEKMNSQIVKEQQEAERWTEFRDRGRYEQEKHIELLKQELADIQHNFEDSQRHLEHVLEGAKEDIANNTTHTLDIQKEVASEVGSKLHPMQAPSASMC